MYINQYPVAEGICGKKYALSAELCIIRSEYTVCSRVMSIFTNRPRTNGQTHTCFCLYDELAFKCLIE